mgnify:FL=1
MKKIIFILAFVFVVIAIVGILSLFNKKSAVPVVNPAENTTTSRNGSGTQTNLPTTDFKNISYDIEGQRILLKNGLAESASKETTRYFSNEVRADLNGDGSEDVAVILSQESSGSGIFYYIAVALNINGEYRSTNSIFLGDRIATRTTEFRNGQIIVNYTDRKPDEPMSAEPSVGVSKYFKVTAGQLVETTS